MRDTKDNIIVNITLSTIIKTVLVLVAFYAMYRLSGILLILLTSIVVASAVEPANKWLMKRGLPRVLSVLFVYVGVIVFFCGGLFFFVPPLLQDFGQFWGSLPQYFAFLDKWNPWSDVLDYKSILTTVASKFAPVTIVGNSPAVTATASSLAQTVANVFHGLVSFILVIVLSFYFSVQERGIENFLKIIVPEKNEKYVIDLWYRSQRKIGKWMQGQLLLGLVVGVLVYLGLTILGVRQAFLLAIIAAALELIPVFGSTLSAVPAVVIAFTTSIPLGFGTIALYVIIQQFENHLIYPIVVRKVVGVPPILVIVALLVGYELAGFMGIILSAPMASVLVELADDLEKKKSGKLSGF